MLPNDLKISSLKEGKNYKAEDIITKKTKRKSKLNILGAPERFLSQNSIVEISSML